MLKIITNRIILSKEKLEKEKNIKIKRKISLFFKKKNNEKKVIKQALKRYKKINEEINIIDKKVNICFEENKEEYKKILNNNINISSDKDDTNNEDDILTSLKITEEKKIIIL